VHEDIDYKADYGPYEKMGMVSGTSPSSTWTVEGRWGGPHDCPLGEGAPLTWGRPGGNGELLGAPHLSWLHVISDCVAVTVLVAFLCRSQRLMLRRDPLMEV